MTPIHAVVLALVAVSALAVVRTQDPARQALTYGFYGVTLGLLFLVFDAPGVALSQALVSGVAIPLLLLFTISRMRRNDHG